ncbi:Uncharacterised protein [Enterobacter cancerogenus]|uniref:Uncharacterized protein n=1 Tax=Enterobacter cancerogenus TaxID=69218 RepID=A0A484ZC10_9ENTR|nr:Uncharacterised protein [Enterobacter cancerogenus]
MQTIWIEDGWIILVQLRDIPLIEFERRHVGFVESLCERQRGQQDKKK